MSEPTQEPTVDTATTDREHIQRIARTILPSSLDANLTPGYGVRPFTVIPMPNTLSLFSRDKKLPLVAIELIDHEDIIAKKCRWRTMYLRVDPALVRAHDAPATEAQASSRRVTSPVEFICCMVEASAFEFFKKPIYEVRVIELAEVVTDKGEPARLRPAMLGISAVKDNDIQIKYEKDPALRQIWQRNNKKIRDIQSMGDPFIDAIVRESGIPREDLEIMRGRDLERFSLRDKERAILSENVMIDVRQYPELLAQGETLPDDGRPYHMPIKKQELAALIRDRHERKARNNTVDQ